MVKGVLHITFSNSQLGRHRQVSSYTVLQSEQEEMLEIEPWLLEFTLQDIDSALEQKTALV